MANYNEYENNRQRDLVLAINEFCFVQNETNGSIKTHVGPLTLTVSQQESLVNSNEKTKRFEKTSNFEQAKQLFVSAPEGWYVTLKNPAENIPEPSKANLCTNLKIGKKINIQGPVSFALYPGQMARVIQGHRLRSNQYLLARVYDAEAASKSHTTATIINSKGEEVKKIGTDQYFVGQLLVIKGTEISFYIPPSGIEVLPIGGQGNNYVRNAITLERLEYAILKNEDGEKRYVHGPAVVFPLPTETFVPSKKDSYIFRALELSPISGIYVKVIADYKDKDKNNKVIEHKTGEELFITGKDQMIYYPRPEHAIIQYDGKFMHHAIAIPTGEGRYIMNRLTGEIKTIKGPQMYLPDPRTEVVVKRKLSAKECQLYYPNNQEVLQYNSLINEKTIEKLASKGLLSPEVETATALQTSSLAIFEANANISRGTSYTKPRTITLDTKYDGVVCINVWQGYAINVVSKTGKQETVVGPAIRLLDYDETLQIIKENETEEDIVYLPLQNQNIKLILEALSKDNIKITTLLTLNIKFDEKQTNNWFKINYIKDYLDKFLSPIFRTEVKKYSVKDFYYNQEKYVNDMMKNYLQGYPNGMIINNITSYSHIDPVIGKIIEQNLQTTVSNQFLIDIETEKEKTQRELHTLKTAINDIETTFELEQLKNKAMIEQQKIEQEIALANLQQSKEKTRLKAKQENAELSSIIAEITQTIKEKNEKNQIALREEERNNQISSQIRLQHGYADAIKEIITAISPELTAALTAKANADILSEATRNMSAYSIAKGESVADTINTLLRGTTLESALKTMKEAKEGTLILDSEIIDSESINPKK